ncbi:MAG TPA: alpha/beta hydrolase [Nitrospirota bacterium]
MNPVDLAISGKRVHVWTGGAGPALLLFHSAWGDAEMSWSSVWSELSRSFTVIAPDLPGFGASEPLDTPSLAASARLLRELLDSRRVDHSVVVGNSFGAAIAIEFASAFSERTRHLVVVNGGYVPALPGLLKKMVAGSFLEKKFRTLMRNVAYSDKALAKAFPDPAAMPAGFFDRIHRNEEQHSRIVFDAFMNQTAPQTPPRVPATIIWGTADRLTTMRQARVLQKWLGNADFTPIDGAGHMPQIERPVAFVDAIKRAEKSSDGRATTTREP